MPNLSPDAFAERVRAYGRSQAQLIAKEPVVLAFKTVAELIFQLTPVLTGHARHNWQASSGSPTGGEVEGVADVEQTGEAPTSDEEEAIESATRQFRGGSDTTLFLTNNLDYIAGLDAGTSAKAPAGIVQPAINAALAVLKDKKLKK